MRDKKSSLDTGKANHEGAEVPAISSDDVAKVQQNLESNVHKHENLSSNKSKQHAARILRGDISEALGIPERGQSSHYVNVESINGKYVTLRISNHNAKVSNFDANAEEEGISIVISRDTNRGLTDDGDSHVIEFFYSDKKLAKAEGNPYVDILKGLQQLLYIGEYKDTTGIAEVQEVNGAEAAKGLVEATGLPVVEVGNAEALAMFESLGDAKLMGSRTDRKMADVAEHYADKELDENQRNVVDVFSGKADNLPIEVSRPEGPTRIMMRQGDENRAGTKHSLYRHFNTRSNSVSTEDIALIPEIIAKGERIANGNKIAYDYTLSDGTRLRVATEIRKNNREEFTNLISDRKPLQTEYRQAQEGNTQSSARTTDAEVSVAKLGNSGDTAKFSIETYHGTHANFDSFDHSHMGEGEGNQSFGWGTYVSESESVGTWYTKGVSNAKGGEKERKPIAHLYTVEIPDDTGENYLDWESNLSEEAANRINASIERFFKKKRKKAGDYIPEMHSGRTGQDVVFFLGNVPTRTPKKDASMILADAGYVGIRYPIGSLSTGNKNGKSNYVIFNDNDLKVTDHVRYLRNGEGVVYGWTVGGKVYLNRDAMNPETPLHEYTHLWDEMVQKGNPELWARGKELLKQTPLWPVRCTRV